MQRTRGRSLHRTLGPINYSTETYYSLCGCLFRSCFPNGGERPRPVAAAKNESGRECFGAFALHFNSRATPASSWTASHIQPAVYIQHVSGDVSRLITGQKRDGMRHLLG